MQPSLSYVWCCSSHPPQKPHEQLLLYYQNVGGINSTVEEYRLAVSDQCFDIIVLVETWLNDVTLSSQIFGPAYEVFRCDRNSNNSRKSVGGGVLIAVNSSLKSKAVVNTSWDCLEQVWTTIELRDRKLYLCALYIPPLSVRDMGYVETHFLGDYNLPSITWIATPNGYLYPDTDHSSLHNGAVKLLDSYSSAALVQVNSIANENNRCLDLCFISDQCTALSLSIAPAPLVKSVAHHLPLLVMVNRGLKHAFNDSHESISFNNRRANHRNIAELLFSIDLHILDLEDVNIGAQTFSNVLAYVIDQHVPKKVCRKVVSPSWYSSSLRRLKTTKRAALRQFTKHRSVLFRNHYVRLNYEFKRVTKECYSQHQLNIQRNLKSHPKRFWQYVNEQRKEYGLPTSMTLNDNTASTT
ncbi:uncharacterized protein LOC134210075 [Armigeres subalbatus]|uniref:uncharacterized protein LOC134210075 n=1 Tax=Armigeres subalbatus TaxID=124917 RepID=UPI002ED13B6B